MGREVRGKMRGKGDSREKRGREWENGGEGREKKVKG